MDMDGGLNARDYLGVVRSRLHTPEDIRRHYGLKADLSELGLDELQHLQQTIAYQLTAPDDRLPAGIRNFLESEHYRVAKQISVLSQQNKIQELQAEVASGVEDSHVREELSSKLESLAQTTDQLAEQFQDIRSSDARASHELRVSESKWRNRMAMLQREPAAVLVGGSLLVLITGALIGGMFSHTEVPEILASGFLLILGFFFGQNSSRGGSSGDSN